MTRIIAGKAGGIRLRVPPKGTRPTTDRVREALFSLLASRLDFDGERVLDLYAGSGALGLEALSRGADTAVFVESDARALAVVKDNVRTARLQGADVVRSDVAAFVGKPACQTYTLVLADPPYTVGEPAVRTVLERLVQHGWLADHALVVVERSARSPETTWPTSFSGVDSRRYGETRIDIAEYLPRVPSRDGD